MYLVYNDKLGTVSYNRDQHPLEIRFRAALKELRFDRTAKRNIKQEMEIDQLVHDVRQYGFTFFPEMYVTESVEALERLVAVRDKQKVR